MRRDLVRHLMQSGCRLVGEGERHSWWEKRASQGRSAVPRHTEIADDLAIKICSDLGIEQPTRSSTDPAAH